MPQEFKQIDLEDEDLFTELLNNNQNYKQNRIKRYAQIRLKKNLNFWFILKNTLFDWKILLAAGFTAVLISFVFIQNLLPMNQQIKEQYSSRLPLSETATSNLQNQNLDPKRQNADLSTKISEYNSNQQDDFPVFQIVAIIGFALGVLFLVFRLILNHHKMK